MHMYSLLLMLHPSKHQSACSFMYEFILLSFIHPSTHPFMQSPICGCFPLSHLPIYLLSMYLVLNLWGCLPLFPTLPSIHQTYPYIELCTHMCMSVSSLSHLTSIIHPTLYLLMFACLTYFLLFLSTHSFISSSVHPYNYQSINLCMRDFLFIQPASQPRAYLWMSLYIPSIYPSVYTLSFRFCWRRGKEKDKWELVTRPFN